MAVDTSEFESKSPTAPIQSIPPRSADESLSQLISVLQETLQLVSLVKDNVETDTGAILRTKVSAMQSSCRDINASFSAATVALNQRSNMDASINKLPDEILTDILLLHLELSPDAQYVQLARQRALLMLVCRHWFSVIHRGCRFWRFISLAWPETKIEEHLTRSRDTGLYLRLNVDEPHLLPKISVIRPHLPRIQHLAVGGDFHDVLTNTTDPDFPSVDEVIDCLLEISKKPLTRLTDLIFRVYQPVASPKLRLPARLDFPSLSTLNLVGCFFRSSLADSLPNSLRNIVIELTELFSDVHDLLRLIIQCPNLESLIFRWLNLKPRHLIQGDDDETASPPAKPVMRPLQILEPWTLSVDDVNVLMENLTFPHLSQLLLRILVTESPSSAVVPRSLIHGMTETQDLVVDLSHSLIKCLYTRLPETKYVLEFTLPAEIPSLHARRIRALTEIARPFKNLRSLHLHARLHSMSSSPPLGVAELFITEAEWLEHLSISGDIVGPALDFLGTTTDTTPCPHLTSLSIDAIDEDFTRAQPLGSDGAGFGSGIGTGHYMWQHRRNMIESCLKHRMAAGLKLSKLKLDSAWMDGDVKRLKRLVDHLDIVNNSNYGRGLEA